MDSTALQVVPAEGGPLAVAGTFVLGALFYALTAHIAARYVLGDVPPTRALMVGPVPALVTILLQQYPVAVMLLMGFIADFLAIRFIYRVRLKTGGLIAVVHYTVTVLLALVLANLVALLGTAPT
ncbi:MULTISPECIES: hypothetical protein [unclassified Haladaptatus]|uniref:DUF7473 family protein n=1 Tax=unclassified Haladaptatus TaxID=2622732 RepID=UPI0023E7DCF5|nr:MULTISPECIES: hypothetical protein [unclassified Haladaptatus]